MGILVIVVFFTTSIMSPVRADGGVISKGYKDIFYSAEEEQYAVIHHEKGYQDMLISIGVENTSANRSATSVWAASASTRPTAA